MKAEQFLFHLTDGGYYYSKTVMRPNLHNIELKKQTHSDYQDHFSQSQTGRTVAGVLVGRSELTSRFGWWHQGDGGRKQTHLLIGAPDAVTQWWIFS